MKKLHTLVIGIPLSCFSLNAFSVATWVDKRYAHTTASEKNQYKIGPGHIFDITAQESLLPPCMTSDKTLIK
ncbi:hypothetical protein [Salmonella enterica]|uniref:hypothetical protein n=1 Tax=Salmonella enterica TaxID=28901 RepID=UPI003EDB8747